MTLLKKINYRILLSFIFLIGLFVSAFVYWKPAEVEYEIPKVWFVIRWIEIFGLAAFVLVFSKLEKEQLDTKLIVLVSLYLAVVVASSLNGTDLPKSISGNFYRADGLITLTHLVVLFFLITLFSSKSILKSFFAAISFSSILLSLNNVFLWIKFYILNLFVEDWYGAFGGPFGNPNFLAGYLIVALPLTYYFFEKVFIKNRPIAFAVVVIQILGVLTTHSWAGVFGVLLFLLIHLYMKTRGHKVRILTVGLILIFAAVAAYMFQENSKQVQDRVNAESRERIIMKGFLAFRNKPIFGYGWANFDRAFESIDYPIHMDNDVYVDKAHSSFLEILVTTGITGFLVYLLIILRVLYNLYQKKGIVFKYLLFSFVLLILHMQTNVISISEEVIFWIIAGFSAKNNLSKQS